MKLGEVIKEAWFNLTIGHRLLVVAIGLVIAGLMVSGWIDSYRSWQEIRVYEQQAAEAKRQADARIAAAAKIATEIRKREQELNKIEVKRDEKQKEVGRSADDAARDRADYERAVRNGRTDAPSTDQLCAELAALGYPCYPR